MLLFLLLLLVFCEFSCNKYVKNPLSIDKVCACLNIPEELKEPLIIVSALKWPGLVLLTLEMFWGLWNTAYIFLCSFNTQFSSSVFHDPWLYTIFEQFTTVILQPFFFLLAEFPIASHP